MQTDLVLGHRRAEPSVERRPSVTLETSEVLDFREGPKDSPQPDPQKEYFGAACYGSNLENATQEELLISL